MDQLWTVIPPRPTADRRDATIAGNRLGWSFTATFECGSVLPVASKLISSVWTNQLA